MNNLFYVIYDDDNNVLAITREFNEGDKYFPIEPYKIIDFITGTKSIQSYYVKHSYLDVYTLEEKKFESLNRFYNEFYEVEQSVSNNDLTIFYNRETQKWKLELSELCKYSLQKDHYSAIIKFYISSSNQLNFLIRTLEIKVEDLINDSVEFSFITEQENNFDDLKISTKKYFNKIGLVNV